MKKTPTLMKLVNASMAAVWLALLIYIGYVVVLSCESQGWPKVPARVLRSSVVETQEIGAARFGSLPFSRFTVDITCTYAVDDQNYTSNRFALFKSLSGFSQFHAETLRNPYLAGKEVFAYYDPADPRRAVLAVGWKGIPPNFVPIAGLIGFLSVGIGAGLAHGRGKRRRKRGDGKKQ